MATYCLVLLDYIYDAALMQNLFDNSCLVIHVRGLFEKRLYSRYSNIICLFTVKTIKFYCVLKLW